MNSQGRVKSGSMTTSSSDAKALATSRFQMLPKAWNMLGPSFGGMRPDAVWRDVLDVLTTVDAVDDGPMKADAPPRGAARSARMDESFILQGGRVVRAGIGVVCDCPTERILPCGSLHGVMAVMAAAILLRDVTLAGKRCSGFSRKGLCLANRWPRNLLKH